MNCRAVYGIKMTRKRFGEQEDVFDADPEFEAETEQGAKSAITRYANKDERIQDIRGAVWESLRGNLPDWWNPNPVKWGSWLKTKREPYEKNEDHVYVECYRRSRDEFISSGNPNEAPITVFAFIRLAWLEPAKPITEEECDHKISQ